jgi:hypothetical protein
MPLIRSLIFKCYAYLIALILLLGEIMLTYSYYAEKGLVYIIIITPFSYQPSSYFKCTKLNIYLSCNVKSVSIDEYIYLTIYFYTF